MSEISRISETITSKENEQKVQSFKLAVIGPPHSGKSVFLSSLIDSLPDGCRIHRACPDGEGDWSQKTDQTVSQKLREKGKFSVDFVDRSIEMIETYTDKILLVDTGGKIDGEDLPLILSKVDGIVVLSRKDLLENIICLFLLRIRIAAGIPVP